MCAQVIAFGMYPLGMENRAVCESNNPRDHPERDGLVFMARTRLTRDRWRAEAARTGVARAEVVRRAAAGSKPARAVRLARLHKQDVIDARESARMRCQRGLARCLSHTPAAAQHWSRRIWSLAPRRVTSCRTRANSSGSSIKTRKTSRSTIPPTWSN